MIYKKFSLVLLISFFFIFFANVVFGDTHYVDTKGNDSTGNGSKVKPWKTVAYALTNAQFGDTISINDGTYAERMLRIPAGISLTSTSQDNTKVKLQPNLSMKMPFLFLSSANPGSEGNQTISHIELNGINGSNRAQVAIALENRNNVRIHHCNIHDFVGNPRSIEIRSTQIKRTGEWWKYWPPDSQEPGTDTNIDALWPSNPVENFEFDNNTVTDCQAIYPYHLKNSSFHHNTIDNRSTYGWCFKGTAAFMDNVDIHDNILLGKKQAPPQTAWKVELWIHRNGCEYYNNKMNGYYSITYGKETKIYNNTIEMDPPDYLYGTGIEFNGQSYGEVYGNIIIGAGRGIRFGADATANSKDWAITNVVIRNNKLYNIKWDAILASCNGGNIHYSENKVKNIDIYENYIDGMTSEELGLSGHRGDRGIRVQQRNIVGTCSFSNVNVISNRVKDITGYAGETIGEVSKLIIDDNRFFGNQYNDWKNGTDINTTTTEITYSPPKALLSPPKNLVVIN